MYSNKRYKRFFLVFSFKEINTNYIVLKAFCQKIFLLKEQIFNGTSFFKYERKIWKQLSTLFLKNLMCFISLEIKRPGINH
jgi:hypothetical protein